MPKTRNGRFRQYFYFNKTYDNLTADLPIRILVGHKGIGKSALLRRAYLSNEDNSELAIWIRPNDLLSYISESDNLSFNQMIENWKSGLLSAIVNKVISHFSGDDNRDGDKQNWLQSSANFALDFIAEFLKKSRSKIEDAANISVVNNYLLHRKIYIYIDDIDRGWTASRSNITSISALLNAIRDLVGSDKSLMFRISLRSDVYYLVRTSDESTDKIERNVIWLSWSNHEILLVMARRIETYFGVTSSRMDTAKKQVDISREILSKIIAPAFDGRGHWSRRPIHNVLLSLTRKRPRDLVKLLHDAARRAYMNNHSIISSTDLELTFESYSSERMQDTINEFRSENAKHRAIVIWYETNKKGKTNR